MLINLLLMFRFPGNTTLYNVSNVFQITPMYVLSTKRILLSLPGCFSTPPPYNKYVVMGIGLQPGLLILEVV